MPEVSPEPVREHLDEPVLSFARKDFSELREHFTVQQALDAVRNEGVGEKVVYFYVIDDHRRLKGVVPTRRLLASPLDTRLSEIMISRVLALPHTATLLEACEMFVMHKLLAFPIVDKERHILGVVDVSLFTQEVFDIAEKEQTNEFFEALGFHTTQAREATPVKAFSLRFPWLLATITSGSICALLASIFEDTIARALVLTFFLTLVLALGESVAMQSMAIAIQALRSARLSMQWFLRGWGREIGAALLLGLGCGGLVALVAGAWRGFDLSAAVIACSIVLSMCCACTFGITVPAVLHWLKWDPKIAAGPVTLALTDIVTLLIYFGLAAMVL
jgi:magnesium transporter